MSAPAKQEDIPVRPEPPSGYKLFAVTWISRDGSEITRIVGALSGEEAAALIVRGVDIALRYGRPSIDVRECSPVQTFSPRVTL